MAYIFLANYWVRDCAHCTPIADAPVIFAYDDIQAVIFKIKQILNKANVVSQIKSSHMDNHFLLSKFQEVFRNLTENHTEEFVAFCSTLC